MRSVTLGPRATRAYARISGFYGERRAARSGVPLMQHIDEGLALLSHFGAPDQTCAAYCLHPLFQEDTALAAAAADGKALEQLVREQGAEVLLLVMEYRHIANSTLSRRTIASAADIPLSPLEPVNDLLRADKIQNYKDFQLHHRDTHPRRDALDRYFRLWLQRLGIDLPTYTVLRRKLDGGVRVVRCATAPDLPAS